MASLLLCAKRERKFQRYVTMILANIKFNLLVICFAREETDQDFFTLFCIVIRYSYECLQVSDVGSDVGHDLLA